MHQDTVYTEVVSGVAVGAGMRGGAIPPKRAIVAEPLAGLEA
eukprot:CAMPEP_0174380218 /NCGR_PEP_ID=MMETSP0811_2-20130205/123225_1 /TAXON_ID=73025 ORGANISM="Eutreptiella gymnastica-like, Strain CCMP1594" /NCGR_SAMPLE_ID=MMETSP0811_2 /ASSEMBLY_ACC=CAM_ASM_000667 /LENGTH=41 /DNA_ID= /DNA_START= /DNA_END= /DNA_ORIENTATION=